MVTATSENVTTSDVVSGAPSLSARLAEFACDLTYEDLPDEVVVHAKRCLLDSVGIAFASGSYDFSRRALLGLSAGEAPGRWPVIGFAERLNRRDAALMNGVLIHGLDYDDTHVPGVVHASASALPTALTVALDRHLGGRELLCGYVIGLEVASRLGAVAGGQFHQVGFHPTGLVGAFGAATVAARLAGLSPGGVAQAQGIVGSMASGSLEFLESGAWTKRLHPGWAAVSGLVSAALAAQGFVGPDRIYEGRFGLYRSHLGAAWDGDVSAAVDGLGERWEVLRIALKPYPACHFTHAFADAAIDLVHGGLDPADIDHVECLIASGEVGTVCEPAEAKRAPKTDYEAKFSLPFVVAASLVRGRLGLAEFFEDTLFDPAIVDLAGKVGYRVDPDSGFPRHYSGEVIVTTKDGRQLRSRQQINRGAEERPLDEATVVEKFRSNVGLSHSNAFADRLAETLGTIDTCSDVRQVVEALRG
jgi:2-methylcitrate dehydratase PrpD